MNLQELQESKKTRVVKQALRENFDIELDFEKLPFTKAKKLHQKVKSLIGEAKNNGSAYIGHKNSTYLKLVMMEQALVDRLSDLRNPLYRVVVENEEVQKSQVILAAQDLIDSLQKMLEQVSKMNVEELNAVVEGMKNEFGVADANKFQEQASGALATLQDSVASAKAALSSALGAVTGEMADAGMDDTGMDDVEAEVDTSELEMEPEPEMGGDIEEPVQDTMAQAATGRERR